MPYVLNFFSLVFYPREHTNPNILMAATQWVKVLLLLMLFEPCVFDDSLHYAI